MMNLPYPLPASAALLNNPRSNYPVPNVSHLLLGTLNEQGRVIWVADLGQFLGYSSILNTDRPEIPVIAVEDQGTMLGLAVNQIVGTDWMDPEKTKGLQKTVLTLWHHFSGGNGS
jgi:purine-binding chemotaxis protein CheW